LVPDSASPIFSGIRVLDLSHQYSGALAACLLGDLGADVVAVEHPEGSPIRTMLPKKGTSSLWWKTLQRNKKSVTLRLSHPKGQEIFKQLVRNFDVVVENFRPGTLEKWGIGPDELRASGADLVLVRISGFGQFGPMSTQPGYGTVAEAMSGFAHLNGFPDGPPVFPSTTLGDGVAATFAAFGAAAALANRYRTGASGLQVVDMALFEGLFRLIPVQMLAFDQLGMVMERPGNFLASHGVLRNLYRTEDGVYIAVAGGIGEHSIRRTLTAVDASALVIEVDGGVLRLGNEACTDFLTRCNDYLTIWCAARPYDEVAGRFHTFEVPAQRVYTSADIAADPQYAARDDLVRVADEELGSILMPGVMPKFVGRTSQIKQAGGSLGSANEEVYGSYLGLSAEDLTELRQDGVI